MFRSCLPFAAAEQDSPLLKQLRQKTDRMYRQALDAAQRANWRKKDVLGELDYAIHASGFPVYPFLAAFPENWEEIISPNPEEVEEVFTIPLSFLRYNPPQKARVEKAYRAVDALPERDRILLEDHPRLESMPTLFWSYEGRLLWGMTARVTDWLLHWLKGLG